MKWVWADLGVNSFGALTVSGWTSESAIESVRKLAEISEWKQLDARGSEGAARVKERWGREARDSEPGGTDTQSPSVLVSGAVQAPEQSGGSRPKNAPPLENRYFLSSESRFSEAVCALRTKRRIESFVKELRDFSIRVCRIERIREMSMSKMRPRNTQPRQTPRTCCTKIWHFQVSVVATEVTSDKRLKTPWSESLFPMPTRSI
jgi:hypothetical protein